MKKVKLGKYLTEYSVKNKENKKYPVYSVTNSNGFCTDYFNKDVSSENKKTYKIVPFGFFAYNPSRINVGSIACQEVEENVIVSPLYTVFKCNELLNRRYLMYFLKSDIGMKLINSSVSGSVRANLKFKTLSNFEIIERTLEEQEYAISIFDSINDLITNCEEQIKKIDEIIESRFIEMFDTLDLSLQSDDWIELEKITEIYTGTTPSTGVESNWDGDVLWITPAELTKETFYVNDTSRKLTESGRKSKSLEIMPVDTVLLTTRAPIGKVGIVGTPMTCNQGFKNFKCKEMLNPIYLYILLKHNSVYLNSLGSGTTFLEISKTKVGKIKIPVPENGRQNEFATFVKTAYESKEILRDKIVKYKELLNKKMDEYFN